MVKNKFIQKLNKSFVIFLTILLFTQSTFANSDLPTLKNIPKSFITKIFLVSKDASKFMTHTQRDPLTRHDNEVYFEKYKAKESSYNKQGILIEKRKWKTVIPEGDFLFLSNKRFIKVMDRFINNVNKTTLRSQTRTSIALKKYMMTRKHHWKKTPNDYRDKLTSLHLKYENTFNLDDYKHFESARKWHTKKDKKLSKVNKKNYKWKVKRDRKTKGGVDFHHISGLAKKLKQVGNLVKSQSLRGKIFITDDLLFGLTLQELRPFHGIREGLYIVTRIGAFSLKIFFFAAAYGLTVPSDGLSVLINSVGVSPLISTINEAITNKIRGATWKKNLFHSTARYSTMTALSSLSNLVELVRMSEDAIEVVAHGISDEIGVPFKVITTIFESSLAPLLGPFGGIPLSYAETGIQAIGNIILVLGYLVDVIAKLTSSRYISYSMKRNIGRPEVLTLMRERINFLNNHILPTLKMRILSLDEGSTKRAKLEDYFKKLIKIEFDLEKKYRSDATFYLGILQRMRYEGKGHRKDIYHEEIFKALENPIRNSDFHILNRMQLLYGILSF